MTESTATHLIPGPGEALLRDARTGRWLLFSHPRRLIQAAGPGEVLSALRVVEEAVAEGLFVAGYVAYEAAPAFDPALATLPDRLFPPVWFGIYSAPIELESLPAPIETPALTWTSTVSEAHYRQAIERIHVYIHQGDTYQVNYTYRLTTSGCDKPWDLFLAMTAAQDPGYGAYLDQGDWVVCSASPELFYSAEGDTILSRPMKGTAPRGRWYEEDQDRVEVLRHSEKDCAENVMIVDMVRNDLGRIAETGTVSVPALFEIERYPTVLQMVSTVTAKTRASLVETFGALFPPASITGAPKCRTMEILSELETTPRRIYTGAIGFATPEGYTQFNVAIRTALTDRVTGVTEYGVGGGIVWDSTAASEWAESRVKAHILKRPRPTFDLLESLLWTPGQGFWLLEHHLNRLEHSARYFGFAVSIEQVLRSLESGVKLRPPVLHKVRVLCSRSGSVRVEFELLAKPPVAFSTVILARDPIDADDVFLYHKTTYREVYEAALRARPGIADVLLYNTRHELTESTRANLVIELDGQLYTPPIACGLLGGTFRADALARGVLREKVLPVSCLATCSRVFLVNSVRGMWEIQVADIPSV